MEGGPPTTAAEAAKVSSERFLDAPLHAVDDRPAGRPGPGDEPTAPPPGVGPARPAEARGAPEAVAPAGVEAGGVELLLQVGDVVAPHQRRRLVEPRVTEAIPRLDQA